MVAFLDLPSGAKRDFVKSPVREFRTPGSVRGHPGDRVLLPRYAPEIGRWPNRDPVGESGGIDLYAFVLNDPTRKFDRLGLDSPPDALVTRCATDCTRAGGYHTHTGCCCGGKKFDPAENKCCESDGSTSEKISMYVINRDPVGVGMHPTLPRWTGGHIDLVIPGCGMVGFYGKTGTGFCGFGMDGLVLKDPPEWNDPINGRPSYGIGQPALICEIKVCKRQAAKMCEKATELKNKPPSFGIIGKNCSTRACSILGAGGVMEDGIDGLDTPEDLIKQLSTYDKKCHVGGTYLGEFNPPIPGKSVPGVGIIYPPVLPPLLQPPDDVFVPFLD